MEDKQKLGLGTILAVWDSISWDSNLSSLTKGELKVELCEGLNLVEVEVDKKTAEKVISYYRK